HHATRKVLGTWSAKTGAWNWMQPWPLSGAVPICPNTILESPLYRLFTCPQLGLANVEPGSSELERIAELPATFPTTSGGNSNRFLWAEVFLDHMESRLVRWTPGTKRHEVFVEGIDGDVCKVDVGGGTIGGFLVRPDRHRSCNLMHDDARFFRVTDSGSGVE